MESLSYPLTYRRIKTRVVKVGILSLGGNNPIRIQSMLTCATNKAADCFQEIQSLRLVGCELIRLAISSQKDLSAVPEIRRLMREEGIRIPLVADVHFSPQLAVDACELFEKVRINPGNFSDVSKSSKGYQNDSNFTAGYEKLKEAIFPFALQLKKHERALRIGVNQGSLSTRMMERFGDSPLGMVESALEMIKLFEEQGIFQIVVSLKSSNPLIVQKAYRLLVERQPPGKSVVLHLGVTESGNGIEGRIKSLVGIGALLADGIGDTIRVSLTEPCTNEIVFARKLLNAIIPLRKTVVSSPAPWSRLLNHQRVNNSVFSLEDLKIGAATPLKIGSLKETQLPDTGINFTADFTYQKNGENFIFTSQTKPILRLTDDNQNQLEVDKSEITAILIETSDPWLTLRKYYKTTASEKRLWPVGMIYPLISGEKNIPWEVQMAGMLSEGLLDFILIPEEIESEQMTRLLFMLQATRAKIVATDYISCPSCGRTLFDLQATVEKIKERTKHLKGLKIGIMGCIVNGPGEMADADFGYVGSGVGKIDLYFGQTRVCRGIDEKQAVERLIQLIKEKHSWK